MKKFTLPVILMFFVSSLFSQESKSYPVKVGESPNKALPFEAQYTFPEFKKGNAFFRSGSPVAKFFNYNFLLDEIQFIEDNGDTLAIADPLLITKIAIDSSVFYYNKGYLKEILNINNYKLALKRNMVQIADKTRGAYDAASGASSITTYGTINNNSQLYRLQVKKDVLFQEVGGYYISDLFNNFIKADKKGFLTVFGEIKPGLAKYIKTEKIHFNKEADLKKLLSFCAQ